MSIEYKRIDDAILGKLVDIHGDDCGIVIKGDTYPLAAMDGDLPIGYTCVTPRVLAYPLEHLKDAYIEVLWVDEEYRRQGIGRQLIAHAEEWAKEAGYRQIRTHSNDKAVEAIKMWHKLNYGLCQHVYYAEEGCSGYWVAKVLSDSSTFN